MFSTPILFLIFNRPDPTMQVFKEIRKIKPRYLFIAADGPRIEKDGEGLLCDIVKDSVLKNIDWDCEVKTLFREENLGCGRAVSEAITWFFDQVEEGIIVEDDCLPDESFFTFCDIMLNRYKKNVQIMHIGGNNFQFGKKRGNGDYYFSIFTHIWGWATWRRAWRKYNFDISESNSLSVECYIHAFNNDNLIIDYWKAIFSKISKHEIDTWDYQWMYSIVENKGIAICPNVNLVKNIGFGIDATHTREEPDWNTSNQIKALNSFKSPGLIKIDYRADRFTMQEIFGVRKKPKWSFLKVNLIT